MKGAIPHVLTLLNLFSGCMATVFTILNRLDLAALFVCIGLLFDYFDGFAARLLKVQSELGVQLDSLADMVTSGVVPGMVMFQLLTITQTGGGIIEAFESGTGLAVLPFMGFAITLGSACRLAYFNVDKEQVSFFKGLPTPANTALILSLPLILLYHTNTTLNGIILNEGFLVGLTVLSTFLLNSRIKLFSLKFETWRFQDNAGRYVFLIGGLLLAVTLRFMAVPLVILLYILISLVIPPKKGVSP